MRGILLAEDFGWSNAPRSSGGGGGSSNTVTNQVQIPQYEQQFSSENQDLARSLSSNPYPQYNAPLVQGFSDQQQQGMAMAGGAASAYQPDLTQAEGMAANAATYPSDLYDYIYANGGGGGNQALQQARSMGPSNSTIAQYMSPYVQQSLAPQVMALQTQLGQQQNQINSQATQAGAFGDARQGAMQALQNFYGNQSLNGLEAQGYNTAFSNALQTSLQEQQNQAQIGSALGGLGVNWGQALNQGSQEAQNAANLYANLAGANQSLGITGANALYNAGQQQQTLGQQELNQAYQQFLNQTNWPFQMLNIRESALSNSPYNIQNAMTVPQANMVAQGFGAGLGALGSIGSMLGSGGGGATPNVFGAA